LRYHVAIARRRHRDDRPPQRRRDGAENVGLGRALQQVGEARREQEKYAEAEQNGEQGVPGIADHPLQDHQPRRVADELERPNEAKQARKAGIEDDVEHAGKGTEKIEYAAERSGPGEP
jgi:hypothetical protein